MCKKLQQSTKHLSLKIATLSSSNKNLQIKIETTSDFLTPAPTNPVTASPANPTLSIIDELADRD